MNLWNLFRHISLKHLRLRKAQIFMAMAGICLGVTAIVSIGVVNRSILFSLTDSFNQVTGKAQIQITGAQSGFPETLVEKVQSLPGVEYAVPVIEADCMLSSGKQRSLMILGVDVLVDAQVRNYSLTGDDSADIPDPLLFLARPDSILVTKTVADREGLVIDQKIQVQTVEGVRTFQIRGILNPEGPARAMGGNLAVMDIFAAQMAFGKEGRIDRIDVSLRPGEDLETARRSIAAALPEGYAVDTPAGRSRQVAVMISRFQDSLDLLSYLAIFVGMYLIYNAVSISVVHRRREIGILRAVGCKRKEIILLFLGETLVMAVIASALGVGLGLYLANSLVEGFSGFVSRFYVRSAATALHVTWFYPAMGFASGIFASLLAAFLPSRSSSRITPASAIRSAPYTEDAYFTARRLNYAGGLCLLLSGAILALYELAGDSPLTKHKTLLILMQLVFAIGISLFTPAFLKGFVSTFNRFFSTGLGMAGRLAGINLRKNLTRNAVAVAAVFFGIAVFVASSGYVYSVRESVLRWLDATVRADIIISSGHPSASINAQAIPIPVDMISGLKQVPGVRTMEPWRRTFITYQNRKVLISASKLSLYPERNQSGNKPAPDVHTVLPPSYGNNVAVNETFAAIFKVKKGDILKLPTPAGFTAFHVTKIVVDYTSDSGVIGMDIETYQRHWGDKLCNAFFVIIEPGAKAQDVQDGLQRRLGADSNLYVVSALEFKNEIRKVLDRTFFLNHALNVITLLIACLGVIVALLASVMERTREIGLLRAIGMLRKQIYGVVVLESALMGLAGGLLGCAAGVIAGWINLEGFFVTNWGSARYYMPVTSILWALVLSTGLSALAGIIPARKAAKTNIVEALSYD
ncbi:MAG: ABC transporter permease [Deltaproteobacteria bacterium]